MTKYTINTKVLRTLREKKDLTQAKLSEELGVHREMISMIERGVRKPNIVLLKKISDYFKVPVSTFCKVDEEMKKLLELLK